MALLQLVKAGIVCLGQVEDDQAQCLGNYNQQA